MHYKIKAHPTRYNGVLYRSRLEARYAVFFDSIGWLHEYEPVDLVGWSPDFRLEFVLRGDAVALLAEVKPYFRISDFAACKCTDYMCPDVSTLVPADGVAALGGNPSISVINFGCGTCTVPSLVRDWQSRWNRAGSSVQWHP